MRYFIRLQYKGTAYHGWQRQPDAISVQEVVEKALSTYLRKEIEVVGSGRTDTGVHAYTQIVHFDISTKLDDSIVFRLNSLLPNDVVVQDVFQVKEEAHARFDATSRSYQYFLSTKHDPFREGLFYRFPKVIDVNKMNEAAQLLLGKQDFQSFSKVHTDVHTFNCDITQAYWREENGVLIFYIQANRFLRGMVRTVVGTLLEVGLGKMTSDELQQVILAKDRKKAGRAVPAEGLFLWDVIYPEEIRI